MAQHCAGSHGDQAGSHPWPVGITPGRRIPPGHLRTGQGEQRRLRRRSQSSCGCNDEVQYSDQLARGVHATHEGPSRMTPVCRSIAPRLDVARDTEKCVYSRSWSAMRWEWWRWCGRAGEVGGWDWASSVVPGWGQSGCRASGSSVGERREVASRCARCLFAEAGQLAVATERRTSGQRGRIGIRSVASVEPSTARSRARVWARR